MNSFGTHCVQGIGANVDRLAELTERSLMLVTALVPHIGYDKAAEIAHRANSEGTTLKQAAMALGYTSADEFDRWVVPQSMAKPETKPKD
jgi:fumarate hydratase class II